MSSAAAWVFREERLRGEPVPVTAEPHPVNVVLVDDNHHHRIPLLRALRAAGYNVLHAADGARGEDLFLTSLREPEALIACAEMRRMSGFELARRIRSTLPGIAVLLMSRSAIDCGFPVIEEPFTPEELTHRLAQLLAEARSSACSE